MGAVKNFLVGAVIGIISMLPGASGATVAVVFGVYERLIGDLAEIRGRLMKDLRFVVVIGLGVLAGLFVCAFGLDALMDRWEIPMMFFFAALILTQIPDVKSMAEGGEITPGNIAGLICGLGIMAAVLAVSLVFGETEDASVGAVVWIIAGIILAVSKMAPGISGSSLLLALGLYTPMMTAMTEFDFSVLIPGAVGLLLGVLVFAKILDRCLKHHRRSTYMAILGLTVGSVVTVTVQALYGMDGSEIGMSVVFVLAGLVLGYLMAKASKLYMSDSGE